MGKGRVKSRRTPKQGQRTSEERDLFKEKEMERVERAERADAERRAKLSPKYLAPRAGGDPPPIFEEPDPLVRAPLKPKPHLRSGAMALCEPETEDPFLIVKPKSISK
jgi:hypothetical protein